MLQKYSYVGWNIINKLSFNNGCTRRKHLLPLSKRGSKFYCMKSEASPPKVRIVNGNKLFLSPPSAMHTCVGWPAIKITEVFISTTNNYVISSNYLYLIIVLCFHAVIWFQISHLILSKYQGISDWLTDWI